MKKILSLCICLTLFLSGCSRSEKALKLQKTEEGSQTAVLTEVSEAGSRSETSHALKAQFVSTALYRPLNFKTQQAVWFSYIDLADMLTNQTESGFKNRVRKAFENVKEMGCNTVYVHVRPFGDAFYDSAVYPVTRFYNGKIGDDPNFDALEIMIGEAHSLGLSVHAWINPLRCEKPEYFEQMSSDYKLKEWYSSEEYFGRYLLQVENSTQLWLNPAYEEVRSLICDGVSEIVRNYKVDGIHIDDYFYPTTDESFDRQAFSQAEYEYSSVSDFRLENTNLLVSQIYKTVKEENPEVLFGISPQGNISNNYQQLYADVKKWCSEEGYCDYIVPQIYYGFENEYQPFEQVAEEWSDMITGDVQLVFGLAYYKVNEVGEYSDNVGTVSRQLEFSRTLDNYGGVALYNYKNMFETKNANSDKELALLKEKL